MILDRSPGAPVLDHYFALDTFSETNFLIGINIIFGLLYTRIAYPNRPPF